ncbi:MAG: glutathione S-transferase family protein [Hyphomicrobiaceae bacterium]
MQKRTVDMSGTQDSIILHNYPQSPVAEKVRVALGIKDIAWNSVEIPRLPPKPKLTQLTGGYRRTPVMQIGADIYCDSQCIIRELERRHPSPTFFPTKDAGLLWCLSRWTDGAMFDLTVKLVLGSAGDDLPTDFAEDRGRLYLGPDWAAGLRAANATLPHLVAQIRAPLTWLDQQLTDGRPFLLGDSPAAIDAQIYYAVWFMRGRWAQGPTFLKEFAHVERWETSVRELGHGAIDTMSSDDAIAVATANDPRPISDTDTNDPQGLQANQFVSVAPDVDAGEQPVEGRVITADADTIVIGRSDEVAGELHVHFPRSGYRVTPLS